MHRARLELMRAAARVFPQLLETPSRDVFPRFDEAAPQGKVARPGYDFEVIGKPFEFEDRRQKSEDRSQKTEVRMSRDRKTR
jgi:hypothetical protein